MNEYTFSFNTTKINELESVLWNRGLLCFDKMSEVNVRTMPKQGKKQEQKASCLVQGPVLTVPYIE